MQSDCVYRDMPAQARDLVNRLNNSDIDFKNDWKMVTLFIGGNNLCDYCNDLVSCVISCDWLIDCMLSRDWCINLVIVRCVLLVTFL